jgi:hypothetical protein
MLAPGWGTGTRGGSPPGVKPVSVLVHVGQSWRYLVPSSNVVVVLSGVMVKDVGSELGIQEREAGRIELPCPLVIYEIRTTEIARD